ncbi:glucokinase [Methylorubrum extorquens]
MTVAWNAPPEVPEAAEDDPVASEAVHRFARLLGRFAGDLELVFSATGGTYLAGETAPASSKSRETGRSVPHSRKRTRSGRQCRPFRAS